MFPDPGKETRAVIIPAGFLLYFNCLHQSIFLPPVKLLSNLSLLLLIASLISLLCRFLFIVDLTVDDADTVEDLSTAGFER